MILLLYDCASQTIRIIILWEAEVNGWSLLIIARIHVYMQWRITSPLLRAVKAALPSHQASSLFFLLRIVQAMVALIQEVRVVSYP